MQITTTPRLLTFGMRMLIVGLLAALLLGSIGHRVAHNSIATAAQDTPIRQKYFIQNSVSKASYPADYSLKVKLLTEIQNRRSELPVEIENRSFLDTEKCKKNCDLVSINVDDVQLVIKCTEKKHGFVVLPIEGFECSSGKQTCLEGLTQQLPSKLWGHDEVHRIKNNRK
jgi:hypothetical protein